MKATSTIWPVVALIGGALVIRHKNKSTSGVGRCGVGHPADWFNKKDLDDYMIYLETGYGKGFTEAELMPWERNFLHTLQMAAEEHERRAKAQQQHIVDLKRERKKAEAQAAFDTYVHYLNNKYGRGFNPGLIDPVDADFYNRLKADII